VSNKSPAFRFYPRDYLADPNVECMSLEEQGAYIRLLCHAWDPPPDADGHKPAVGCLPNDPVLLATLSRLGRDGWAMAAPQIMRAWRVSNDGRYIVQKRMMEEWRKQQDYGKSKSEAGKKGAAKRWQSHASANGKTMQVDGGAFAFASATTPQGPPSRGESSPSALEAREETVVPSTYSSTDNDPIAALPPRAQATVRSMDAKMGIKR
jgi:uncharacterized protein YdaU (DUF1376 family)